MSQLKNRFVRAVRANLNDLLDRVKEFEERGGVRSVFDPPPEEEGWEDIDQGQSSRPPQAKSEKTLREYYANLEVEFGADLPTVKAAYRRLMKRCHPDKHSHDPEMEALATELSQELARAYQAIESYLTTGRY